MWAVVGDETGLLKLVNTRSKQVVVYSEQNRETGVVGLSPLQESLFSVFRKNGQIELWRKQPDEDSLELLSIASTGILNGVSSFSADNSTTVCFGPEGEVVVARVNEDSWANVEDDVVDSSCRFNVRGPLSAGCAISDGYLFGGNENDVQIYDKTTLTPVWTAKNVPQDKLRLRVPIWISSLASLRKNDSVSTGVLFASGTGHRQIRLYDTAASLRPVASLEVGEFRVSTVQAYPRGGEHQLYVADVAGGMSLWDLRMQRRLFTLRGSAGSIRDMQTDKSGKLLACVGLDRTLHVYDTKTNKVSTTVYLKNRLNKCLPIAVAAAGPGEEVVKRKKKRVKKSEDSQEDLVETFEDSDSEGTGSSDEEEEEVGGDEEDEEEEEGELEGEDDDDEEEDNDEEEEEEVDEEDDEDDEVVFQGSDDDDDDVKWKKGNSRNDRRKEKAQQQKRSAAKGKGQKSNKRRA